MTVQPQKSLTPPLAIGKSGRNALWLIAVLPFSHGGCAAPGRTPPPASDFIVAARYDVGQRQTNSPRSLPQGSFGLLDELQQFRSIGFNAVVFDYVEDAARPGLLDMAAAAGLRAYLTDRDIHYYLLTGKIRGAENLAALIHARLTPLRPSRSFAGVAILSGYPRERVVEVQEALNAAGVGWMVPGQGGYPQVNGTVVAWLDAEASMDRSGSHVERVLLEFNAEIFAGWNDGLVIDFAPVSADAPPPHPQEWTGEESVTDETAPQQSVLPPPGTRSKMYAVASILERARHWAARLHGFQRSVIGSMQTGADAGLQSALFVKGPRRYLFIHNQSSQVYRGTLRYPSSLAGRLAIRAVAIPASPDRVAGEVYPVRSGELALPLTLRPGDAALFELF